MTAQEIDLQRFERVGRNLDFGERSKPGVDAVRRLVAIRLGVDDGARRADARDGIRRETDRFAVVGDRQQLLECEGRTVKLNHFRVE